MAEPRERVELIIFFFWMKIASVKHQSHLFPPVPAPGSDPESLPLSLGIALLLFSAVPASSSGLFSQTVPRIEDGEGGGVVF